ncbi:MULTISPECIES: helix-turn-helix transcriptional regulator [Comamonadaceae]|uniref:Prophage CP4-57 regulatory n=1 Tax=Alicycliphilus denitrificans (strain DSM 14773 / CIP 107495 / K601) TaxID=596154 RepID=F4G973_ALIDK|nr:MULTISPECIES: AlpA family phage regulatory protein [Comamonadaceae]AEB85663.1 Prophage CP4-57 regulatory [Alicycliphilus denitrificans K601]
MQVTSTTSPAAPAGLQAQRPRLPDTGFVRQKLLLSFVPFSKSTLWRRVNEGVFPAPIRLSVGITAWRVEDVRRWIAEQD